MTPAAAASPPSARAWKAWARRARRARHRRPVGELLGDLYTLLWLVLVYGGILVVAARRHLETTPPPTAGEPYWMALGACLVVAGLGWRGLRSLGPVLATPAEQAWGVSTPVDRASLLRPRLALVVLVAGGGGAILAAALALGLASESLRWMVAVGVLAGAALAGGAAAVQGGRGAGRWAARVTPALVGAGAVTVLAVVVAHRAGRPLSTAAFPPASSLALAAVPLAAVAVGMAVRRLGRVDRAALDTGAQLAMSTVTAAVALDPSVLSGVLETRRWRRVGRVSSRPFRLPRLGRAGALLQAELRRQLRRPEALAIWAGLALAFYGLGLVAPSLAGPGRLVLAYLAVGRLASGLRALERSPGLRRALGGAVWKTRLAHLVVPALGAVAWWLLTAPAAGAAPHFADPLLVVGVVAAVYRSATRPPMSYGGVEVETPFGPFPMELVLQMARGPDILAATIVARMLAAG